MATEKNSAEIYELEEARARLRALEIDPKNYLAVGPFLEAVREKQGLSLTLLAERTHIKAAYLEAIEQMAVDELPSRAFAIGFVKVYAEALGLDPSPVVTRFKDETGSPAGRAESNSGALTMRREAGPPPEPKQLSLLAVVAILAFVLFCFYGITHPGPDAVREPFRLGGVVPEDGAGEIGARPGAADFDPGIVPPAPVLIEARLIERIDPVYPPACESGAAPIETVAVAFTVTAEGGVVSERVTGSSNDCFDRSALNAVKRWRFSPRTIDGDPRPAFEQTATLRFDRPS